MTIVIRFIVILLVALTAACAGVHETTPDVVIQTQLLPVDSPPVAPNQDQIALDQTGPPPAEASKEQIVALEPTPVVPHRPVMTGNETIKPELEAEVPLSSQNQSITRTGQPLVTTTATVSVPPPVIEKTQTRADPPVVIRTVEPPLDVASLQTRLRDTKAIGLFTKIALKNQVDDLLQQFKTHYQTGQNTSVTSLRQPYDMLVLKVLALVQDEDPSLARTISGSREAIWVILADQEKFNLAT